MCFICAKSVNLHDSSLVLLFFTDEETFGGYILPKNPQLGDGRAGLQASSLTSEAILLITAQYCFPCWV